MKSQLDSRRLLSRLALTLLTALWLSSSQGVEAAEKKRILLIGKQPDHPWATHMYLHTCQMLAKCLERTKGIEAIVSNGWPKDRSLLEEVRTIVLYTTPGAEFLLDSPAAGEVDRLMKSGVGIVTIHWASSVFQANLERLGPRWLGYLGGTWVSNVGLSTGKSPLHQLAPDHPVCRGWSEYVLHDEYYLDPTIRTARRLLEVETAGRKVTVAWAHERKDGGRAFSTTLGHFYRNFQIEAFRRMIVNGILWTAHVDIPFGGADVALSEAELALPPKPQPKPRSAKVK